MRAETKKFAVSFGANVARHRLLGDLAALPLTAVGQLERWERVARADALIKLAAALGGD